MRKARRYRKRKDEKTLEQYNSKYDGEVTLEDGTMGSQVAITLIGEHTGTGTGLAQSDGCQVVLRRCACAVG